MKIYLLRKDSGDKEDFWPLSAHTTPESAEKAFLDETIVSRGYFGSDIIIDETIDTWQTADDVFFIQVMETED